MTAEQRWVLNVACPSKSGQVAAISGFLDGHGCYINEFSCFDDDLSQRFFVRADTAGKGVQIQLLAVFTGQQALKALKIAGVLFLFFRRAETQLIQNLIFNVFGIGNRSQLLFRAVRHNPGGIIHAAGSQRLAAAVEQTGQRREGHTAALLASALTAELVSGAGERILPGGGVRAKGQ